MTRNAPQVRDARPEDAEALIELWAESVRRPDHTGAQADARPEAERAIGAVAQDPSQRFVVGELAGRVVGAAHLVRLPLSPLSTEGAVHVRHLMVLEDVRQQGVGTALVDAAVAWAEEQDAAYVVAAAHAQSRAANRFMARLGLGQLAVMRSAPVHVLRSRLPVDAPACARVTASTHRSVRQVLTQRRSQRRVQGRAQTLSGVGDQGAGDA